MNKLPEPYKAALRAIKEQAAAATEQITSGNRKAMKAELKIAKEKMASHDAECKAIYRMLMKSADKNLTIDTLDEDRLAKELGYAI